MKILDRETYVKHRTNYRIINSLLMVIRLVSVIFITALFILAIIFSLVGESFEEKYNNIKEFIHNNSNDWETIKKGIEIYGDSFTINILKNKQSIKEDKNKEFELDI